ncbi:MAG: hypothetical protein QM537_07150 [Candidatus Symbiobacter sp.]|nr:hypothetical protein [Candidatus Symbiobacter sp.]
MDTLNRHFALRHHGVGWKSYRDNPLAWHDDFIDCPHKPGLGQSLSIMVNQND